MLIWDRTALVCVTQNIEMFAMLAMEESNQIAKGSAIENVH